MSKITALGLMTLLVAMVESLAPSVLTSAETLATIAQMIGTN